LTHKENISTVIPRKSKFLSTQQFEGLKGRSVFHKLAAFRKEVIIFNIG